MGMQAGLQYTFMGRKHTAHADSEMKRSGIELCMAQTAEMQGSIRRTPTARGSEAESSWHGVNRRNARKHTAHAISEMKRSGIELARRKQK